MNLSQLYLFDLDGTIYRGRTPVPHAAAVVAELVRRGAQVRYLTNNSAARPTQVSALLNHMGVMSKPEWVYGTGPLAARHCLAQGYSKVFLVGEEALKQTLLDHGIGVEPGSPDAVVVGICRNFTYEWLDEAARYIRGGAQFVATNTDATFPSEGGRLHPGAGSIVAAVEVASGKQAQVLGKPEPGLARWAMDDAGIRSEGTVVVGDRIDTDIACAKAAGCASYLVLTGVETSIPDGQSGGPDLRGLL